MMCPKCGNDFSPKVWDIHMPKCQALEANEKPVETIEIEALREIAKERGISKYWLKSRKTLEEELSEG